MSNIVYLKHFFFGGGGGFSRLVFILSWGSSTKQIDIIISDEFITEIIFFSIIFSFSLYILIFVCLSVCIVTLNYVNKLN